jgi:hypothetical protein
MSKQTAVQWYRLESQKLMIKAIRKEISNEEWRLLENKLGEEVKEMEREQTLDFTRNAVRKILDEDRQNPFNLEQYYNETYGGQDE